MTYSNMVMNDAQLIVQINCLVSINGLVKLTIAYNMI